MVDNRYPIAEILSIINRRNTCKNIWHKIRKWECNLIQKFNSKNY